MSIEKGGRFKKPLSFLAGLLKGKARAETIANVNKSSSPDLTRRDILKKAGQVLALTATAGVMEACDLVESTAQHIATEVGSDLGRAKDKFDRDYYSETENLTDDPEVIHGFVVNEIEPAIDNICNTLDEIIAISDSDVNKLKGYLEITTDVESNGRFKNRVPLVSYEGEVINESFDPDNSPLQGPLLLEINQDAEGEFNVGDTYKFYKGAKKFSLEIEKINGNVVIAELKTHGYGNSHFVKVYGEISDDQTNITWQQVYDGIRISGAEDKTKTRNYASGGLHNASSDRSWFDLNHIARNRGLPKSRLSDKINVLIGENGKIKAAMEKLK